MKLTKQQRAQVVELLRCAADLLLNKHSMFPRLDAIDALGTHREINAASFDAIQATGLPRNEYALLEAAQRVEEGSWP